ncbi:hypothetical protein [Vibrio sp. Hal054]|uniref:hypothetical protein n=1 Tax=Vibrio sp. Hal054 TaxID=3035158 RepID=UPI00301B9B1C
MAKIFAIVKNDADQLQVVSWSSRAEFRKTGHSFLDEQFIAIATTDDYKERGIFADTLAIECEPVEGFSLAKTEEEVNAHNLLNAALKEHFKGKVFPKKYY